MVAAQARRANAVTSAFRDGTAITPLKIGYTVAEGLAAGDPGKKGEWGSATSSRGQGRGRRRRGRRDPRDPAAARHGRGHLGRAHRRRRLAVLARLLADRRLDPEQTICAIISETGLKTEGEPPSRTGVAFDFDSLSRLVAERLA